MLIIAGWLAVDPAQRDDFVDSHRKLIERSRHALGCLDLAISADPMDPARVNLLERWDNEQHLAAWRAIADPPEPVAEVLGGDVQKYQISSAGPPFDQPTTANPPTITQGDHDARAHR